MTVSRGAQLRMRFVGLSVLAVGVALVVVTALIQSARFDEIDAVGGSGYSTPVDFVLVGLCVVSLISGAAVVWRARD